MRRLVILLSFLCLIAGPLVYFGIGEPARNARRVALAHLAEQQALVDAALSAENGARPPSRAGLDAVVAQIDERRSARKRLFDRVLSYRATPAPIEGELRTLGTAAGLDAALLEAVLASMPPGAVGEARRHVLAQILAALSATPGATLRELKVARELSTPTLGTDDRELPIRALRIDLTARGDAATLVQFTERLLATRDGVPVTDLAHLDLAPDLSVDPKGDLPPLVLTLVVDALVTEGK